MYTLNRSHDPRRTSWVPSAHQGHLDFPIQNLPWCVAEIKTETTSIRKVGTRIGDQFLALEDATQAGLFKDFPQFTSSLFSGEVLSTELLSLSLANRTTLRLALSDALSTDAPDDLQSKLSSCLYTPARYVLPIKVGDYTDFYASVHHATNVGTMFRPTNPLLPNYKWLPVGYHGRASSVIGSGEEIPRPIGQLAPTEEGGAPRFGPCMLLDYELEMGVVIGGGNERGQAVSIESAEEHLFGLCLLNDWSARDIQKWEYQPLGPFLAKNFATSLSPFIVTLEALTPFRAPAEARPNSDPQPLAHLDSVANRESGNFDIQVSAFLQTHQMAQEGHEPLQLSQANFKAMYWTFAQMCTHHTSSGCNLQSGDVLGSGTISGPDRRQRGCLLELTWDGSKDNPLPGTQRTPILCPTGEERKFLANGDEVILTGHCEREGAVRIGFGECRGRITL